MLHLVIEESKEQELGNPYDQDNDDGIFHPTLVPKVLLILGIAIIGIGW
jgi:hypothetical protein